MPDIQDKNTDTHSKYLICIIFNSSIKHC